MIRVCQYLSFPAYARKGDNFTNPNDSIAKYAHDNWTYEVRGEDPHASSGKEDANASGVSNPSLSFQSLNISTFGEESQNSAQYLLNHFVGRSRNTETELSTEKQVVTTTAEGHAESHDAASHVALGESSDWKSKQSTVVTTSTSEGHAESNAAAHVALGESSVLTETPGDDNNLSGEFNDNGVNSDQRQRKRKNKRSSPDTEATATEASAKKSRTVSEEDGHTTLQQALKPSYIIM